MVAKRIALLCIALMWLSCEDVVFSPVAAVLQQCVRPDAEIEVSGTVAGVTFDNIDLTSGTATHYELAEYRYYLLNPVNLENPDCYAGPLYDPGAWGLAVKSLASDFGEATPSPQKGSRLRVKGLFRTRERNKRSVSVLEDVQGLEIITYPDKAFRPGLVGEPCLSDMDCDDQLICERTTSVCGRTPIALEWGSLWHDIHGACETDEDCPLGQTCFLDYMIEPSSEFEIDEIWDQDLGKHLCVIPEDADLETLCPRMGISADFVGGRYVTGKEICVRGKVLHLLPANYGKTHVQLDIDNPAVYPGATHLYAIFGATTEIDFLYKDAFLGSHAVDLPEEKQSIIVLGTNRFDNDHGWFEIHPVKAWWPDE